MIYAHEHGIVALTYNYEQNYHGHDGLADRLGITSGKMRENYIVGGGIKFDGKKFITSELSEHYGHLWTTELRQKFVILLVIRPGMK